MRALRGLLNAGIAAAALFGPTTATAQPVPSGRQEVAPAPAAPTRHHAPPAAPPGAPPAAPPAATSPETHDAAPAPAQAEGHEAAPPRDISLHGDKLTVRVTDVQVEEVLKAITAPSNAEIKGTVKESRAVTIDFTDVPVQDGLGRILGDQNFLLTYREGGELKAITLLGAPLEESAEARIVKNAAGTTTSTQPSTLSPGELMQRSVPISGRLQQVLGQPTATMQQLMDISIHEENAGLRTEAIRAGMQAIDNAPDMRSSVLKSLEGADDGVLASMLRNVAQGRANEIISQVAATSRTPEIRTRGMQILRNLNAPTEPAETQ